MSSIYTYTYIYISGIIVKVTKFLWRTEDRSTKDGNRVVSIEIRNENMGTRTLGAAGSPLIKFHLIQLKSNSIGDGSAPGFSYPRGWLIHVSSSYYSDINMGHLVGGGVTSPGTACPPNIEFLPCMYIIHI